MTGFGDVLVPLFVPGDKPERFEKAALSGADAVIVDLEDAVEPSRKARARAMLRSDFGGVPICVRINAIGTCWHEEDTAALSSLRLGAVILPKAEASPAFYEFCATSPIPVVALIESARGVADARAIAAAKNVVRVAFGSIDYCADLGCSNTNEVLLAVRCELALASRLAGAAAPFDGVTLDIRNVSTIQDDAHHAAQLGFGGKLAIHPNQIAPIRAGFMPAEAEINWAHRVLSTGNETAAVDGMMVDRPVRARAQQILKRARNKQDATQQ